MQRILDAFGSGRLLLMGPDQVAAQDRAWRRERKRTNRRKRAARIRRGHR